MAGHADLCLLFSSKLALVLFLVVLKAPCVFITADDQNGFLVECKDEAVSTWHWWIPLFPEGTKCDIHCPLDCSCSLGNYSEVIVNCLNGSISVTHVSYPSNVTQLSWAHNEIQNISKDSFDGLVDTLEALHLNNNSLQHLQPGVFERLTKLLYLDLRHNMLEKLLRGVFVGLGNLSYLDLYSNKLKGIQPGVFRGLGNLSVLYLHSNRLEEIQLGVFNGLGNLSYLDLDSNMFKEIQPGAFNGLGNLSDLSLSSTMLEEIQPGVFKGLGNLTHLYLYRNMLKEIKPGAFKGLGNLTYLYLSSNMLKEIQSGVFNGLGNLSDLSLSSNMLKEIQPGAFKGLGNLSYLDLDSNMLKEIQSGAFKGLGNLTYLSLSSNMLKEIQPGAFNGLGNLTHLNLYSNMLEEIQPGVFSGLEKLEQLSLSNNMLTSLLPTLLRKLTSLILLVLSHNPLAHLHPDTFQNLTILHGLILRNTSLTYLPENIFQASRQLGHLDLSANDLSELQFRPFEICTILEILNLTQNPLKWISKDSFIGLNMSTNVLVDNPASCCFVAKANCIPSLSKSPFLSCGRLLPYDVLRVGIWIVSIFAIVNNVLGILVRCKQKKQANKVQFLLITNLSISDLLMGLYLISLLSVDLYYTDYFPSHSEAWRNSTLCKIAGSLSVLSSEASVFFITMISIDRAIAINFPFRAHRGGTKSTCIIVSFLWLVALGISITSFVLSMMDSDVYAVPEICVGLPFSRQPNFNMSETSVVLSQTFNVTSSVQEHKATSSNVTMHFSIAIFTGLNLFCFFIVGFCYLSIFITATKTTKKSGRSSTLKEDIQMAKKMFLLVLTDFCCWVPVGVLSILVQAGAVEVHPVAYAWIATFILPINSSINPFLYTLGDFIADKVFCSCTRCKKESSDENIEMTPISKTK